jgi:hypothetical protein
MYLKGREMQIYIVKLGHPQVDIQRVINIINNNQNIYELIYKTQVPNLGKSDLDGWEYSDNLLFNILAPHIIKDYLTIGLTSVQLEYDWFIRPNSDRSGMVITIYQADSVIEKAQKTIEDFVIYKIITCILTREFFTISGKSPFDELIHDDCRGCLFDLCPDKESRAIGLIDLKIDDQCKGILLNANVPQEKITAIESVLKYMKKPSFRKSAYSIKQEPILAGFFGIGIGIMVHTIATYLFEAHYLAISIIFILLFTLGIISLKYLYDLYRAWR